MIVTKLQALVYDILPSTTAIFSYAIGSRKLSANEQFFVGVQTVVSLLQTTQIISDVCFIKICCYGFVTHQILQQSTCHNRVLNYIVYKIWHKHSRGDVH